MEKVIIVKDVWEYIIKPMLFDSFKTKYIYPLKKKIIKIIKKNNNFYFGNQIVKKIDFPNNVISNVKFKCHHEKDCTCCSFYAKEIYGVGFRGDRYDFGYDRTDLYDNDKDKDKLTKNEYIVIKDIIIDYIDIKINKDKFDTIRNGGGYSEFNGIIKECCKLKIFHTRIYIK